MRLFSSRHLLFLPLFSSLCSCSLLHHKPETHATGYLADRGVVRIWQHTTSSGLMTLQSVFTPFDQSSEIETLYHWDQGHLVSITKQTLTGPKSSLTARFSFTDGSTSFMQQQNATSRHPLTADELELIKFDAQRVLVLSRNLLRGRVVLHQGRWISSQQIDSCEGSPEAVQFDDSDTQRLNRLSQKVPAYLAWIDGPQGQQVLLMTSRNLCQQQPHFVKE